MAFSWGGFARTLNDNIIKNQDAEREEASWTRRKKMEMELEKQYGAEVVSRTAIVGNEEISYNKFGDKIRSRLLTAEELAVRKAEVDQTVAGAKKAVFEADTAPEAFQLNQDIGRQQIRASQAGMANDAIRTRNDTLRASREGLDGSGLPKALAQDYYELVTTIESLPPDGVNSVDATVQSLDASIAQLRASGDLNGIAVLLAREKGRLAKRAAELKASSPGFSNLAAPPSGSY